MFIVQLIKNLPQIRHGTKKSSKSIHKRRREPPPSHQMQHLLRPLLFKYTVMQYTFLITIIIHLQSIQQLPLPPDWIHFLCPTENVYEVNQIKSSS